MRILFVCVACLGCTWSARRGHATPTVTSDGSIGPEPRRIAKVRALAAEMLGCPRAKVDVGQIDAETFNVGGCGKTATLKCFKAKRFACHAQDESVPAASAGVEDIDRPFDKEAARRTLKSISYADCGTGGPGKITVTFAPEGTCTAIKVSEGTYEDATRACIESRFAKVSVPPFDGTPRTIRYAIDLPTAP